MAYPEQILKLTVGLIYLFTYQLCQVTRLNSRLITKLVTLTNKMLHPLSI